MNNFVNSMKNFFKNKNTVTVIGVIAVLGILYWGYSSTVNKAVEPVEIPVAANKIKPGQKITEEDIKYVTVPGITVSENVVLDSYNIVGKYANLNSTVPEGSMFYSDLIVSEENLPGKWIEKVKFKEGEEAYYLNTDAVATFGNSVVPKSYIDIYMKANDENGLVMYGKLLENIKVLAVHDGSGNNVFEDSEEQLETAYLGFAVTQEYYLLLKKAQYLTDSGIELVIAPHGTNLKDIGDVAVRSEDLRDYVIAKTAQIDTDVLLSEENTEEEQETEKEQTTTGTTIPQVKPQQ